MLCSYSTKMREVLGNPAPTRPRPFNFPLVGIWHPADLGPLRIYFPIHPSSLQCLDEIPYSWFCSVEILEVLRHNSASSRWPRSTSAELSALFQSEFNRHIRKLNVVALTKNLPTELDLHFCLNKGSGPLQRADRGAQLQDWGLQGCQVWSWWQWWWWCQCVPEAFPLVARCALLLTYYIIMNYPYLTS